MSKLLRSRKFVLAVVALLIQVVALAVPDTRPYANELGGIVFAVVSVAIFGITAEDSLRQWATRPATPKAAIREIVEEVLSQLPDTPSGAAPSPFVAGMLRDGPPYG